MEATTNTACCANTNTDDILCLHTQGSMRTPTICTDNQHSNNGSTN